MPIDPLKDKILSLKEVSELLPQLFGKKVHTTTITRWIKQGCRGVRLEGVVIGNSLGTTEDALRAFLHARTSKTIPTPEQPAPRINWEANERAKRRLEAAGF